jgi:hypothetical protein
MDASLGAEPKRIEMSLEQTVNTHHELKQQSADLEALIERVVEITMARIEASEPQKPFLTSRECARLIAVTPEHLCAMRNRNEGPPWSGEGKWIRYERCTVFRWLSGLPRSHARHQAIDSRKGVRS